MHGKFLFALFSAVTMLAAAGEENRRLEFTLNTMRHLPADECRATLMIEESAPTMVEAKRRCDEKLRLFTETAAKEIPGFRICATPMVVQHAGDRYSTKDRSARPVFVRGITVALPPDEALAAKLLDIGDRYGTKPVVSHGPFTFEGPVGFVVGDENEKILGLYAELLAKFRNTVDAANRSTGADAKRHCEIEIFVPVSTYGRSPDEAPVELLMIVRLHSDR